VYASVVFGLWIVPTWLLVLLAPGREQAARITSPALRLYMALVGCRIRVEGREHLQGHEARIYVSNHTSYFDVLVLMAALGIDYRFVAKIEVHSMPFIGTFLRKLGHVAFDRSDPQARLHQAEEIEQFLRRGESVFVFPEGTFTPQTGVRPFQLGAFKAAVTTSRPIYPVALRGTRRFLRDQTYLPRPTRVTLTVCPPLEPASTSAPSDWHEMVRLRDATRAAIARHCGEPLL
jgi:1-acyl-sn-glycerol-3-phosphate acyltransferase